MIKQLILSWAFSLYHSQKYRERKSYIRELLTGTSNPFKKYLDAFIIFLIVTSVFILVYEVRNSVPLWLDYYDFYFISFVFFVEYILRLWVHNDLSRKIVEQYNNAQFVHKEFLLWPVLKEGLSEKLKYVLTPAAIVDLLAIFPAYRPLRVLRIFILFRVLKLLRYTKSINQFVEVISTKRFELLTLLFLLFFIVTTAGIALYVLEESLNPEIDSLFDAIYWSLITISTVGYGDIAPVTNAGRVISMLTIISGIAMISFATSVIVSSFSERLIELKENRIIEQINKQQSFLIVCGYGQMTKMFFRQHQDSVENYIILDTNIERIKAARKDGYNAIHEDASRYETINQFNIDHSKITILCLTASDIENIYITLNAKSISSKIQVITRVNDADTVSKFEYAGADHLIMPHKVVNTMVQTAITQPTMYKAIHAILTGKNIASIDEIHVHTEQKLLGKAISEIDFKEHKLLFIGLEREGTFMFNPQRDMKIEKHDVLLVMGRKISIDYFAMSYAGAA